MSRFRKPDRIGSVIVLFLLFIIGFGQSDAFNSRKLAAISDQGSPSLSPPPPGKTPNLPQVEAPIPPKPKDKTAANASDTEKGSESAGDKKLDPGKSQDGKGLGTFASENCKKNPICNDQGKSIVACAQDFKNGSNNLTLIVQNEQDVDLKVNITFGTSSSYLQTFELPAHVTYKVNIPFIGEKSNKIILNAGNGDCELQISQPSPVNSPSKPKDPENIPNVKDVNNTADSPTKPKDVNNSTDSPIKPNDVNNPVNSPTKPTDEKVPAKSNADASPKSTEVNAPPKSKEVNTPPKSQEVNTPPKSQEVNAPPKSQEVNPPPKSQDVNDGDRSKSTTNVNTSTSKNNFLDQLTFYSKQVTPIHGAYAAFLVALVIGGLWAICSFRKRRTDGGVRYQELEMGPTESSHVVDVEVAEGWEQDWDDDDWDEDKAIRSPGGNNHAKTVSSNGLTSRATKKDSWDADWDD